MQPRFVFNYQHFTGARCIVTVSPSTGNKVTINFSFRSHKGFTWHQVRQWSKDWDSWASAITAGYFDISDPPGWILTSELKAA